MANIVYGLNSAGGFSDVIDTDEALKTLGLDPKDLKAVNNISGFINENQLHSLSRASGSPAEPIPTNIIERVAKFKDATNELTERLESRATVAITSSTGINTESIEGNVNIKGPLAAKAIRYFSTDLMNKVTGALEPLDISTSRVSSWSRNGSTITYGGALQISNESPRAIVDKAGQTKNSTPTLAIGKLVIDQRQGKTEITPRTFLAEQPTHKLYVEVNGSPMYLYAMKNIPLAFKGVFQGKGGTEGSAPIFSTESTGTVDADYRVIQGRSSQNFFTNNTGGDLRYPNRSFASRTIEVYQAPAKLTEIQATGLNIKNFPNAEYSQLVTLTFSNNLLETFPSFTTIAPRLTSLDIRDNPFFTSPVGSDPRLNRMTNDILNRIPATVQSLRISSCFGRSDANNGRVVAADFKRRFHSLTALTLGSSNEMKLNSPGFPEVPTTCTEVIYNEMEASRFPGHSECKTIPLGGGYSRLDSDLDVNHNSDLDTVIAAGTVTRHSILKIRRTLNCFSVEVNSPGAGYTAGSFIVTKPGVGPIGTIGSITNNGNDSNRTADKAAANYATTTNGSGSGALLNISTDANGAATVALSATLGSGYKLGETLTVDNALLGDAANASANIVVTIATLDDNIADACTGAFSPQGIPFGTVTITVDGAGGITGGTFLPHNSPREFAKSIVTFPQGLYTSPAGSIYTETVHKANASADTPYGGYSPCGFYYDCGLFSSPTTLREFRIQDAHAFVGSKYSAIRNPLHSSTSSALSSAMASVAYSNGGKVNNPHHHVYKNIKTFLSTFANLPPPMMKDSTSLQFYTQNSSEPHSAITTEQNLMTKYRDTLKILPGLDCPTNDELSNLIGSSWVLYESPKDSPAQPTGQGGQSLIRGKGGTFKFNGCSELQTLNLQNSEIGGTLPKFTGCNALTTVNLQNTRFNRAEVAANDTPVFFPLDQFEDCKGTLKDFRFSVSRRITGNSAWQSHRAMWGTEPGYSGSGTKIDYIRDCGMERAKLDDTSVTPNITAGDFPTDRLTALTYVFIKSRSTGTDKEYRGWRRGIQGYIPTFKNAPNLAYIYLQNNNFGRDPDYPSSTTYLPNVIENWNVVGQAAKVRRISLAANVITGTLSFQKLANGSNASGEASLPLLQQIELNWNFMDGVSDWGATGVTYPYLNRISAVDAFYSRDSNIRTNGFKLPNMQDKFPALRSIEMRSVNKRGTIAGFTTDGDYSTFRGMTRLRVLDLRSNKFNKSEIIKTLKAIEALCLTSTARRISINFTDQTEADGLNGFTDFRLQVAGDEAKGGYADGWETSATGKLANTLEDNDLIARLTDKGSHACTISGLYFSNVPQPPDAPTGLAYNMEGVSGDQLQASRTMNDPTDTIYNLYNYGQSTIRGSIDITGIDEDTDRVVIKLIDYKGAQRTLYDIPRSSFASTNYAINQVFELSIVGTNSDINSLFTEAPKDLNTVLAEDVTDYSQHQQAITFLVETYGYRGQGEGRTITYQFRNQRASVDYSTLSTTELAREWRDDSGG